MSPATTGISEFCNLSLFRDAGIVLMATIRLDFEDAQHDVFPFPTMRLYTISIYSALNIVGDFMRHGLIQKVVTVILSKVQLKHQSFFTIITPTSSGAIALEDDGLRADE